MLEPEYYDNNDIELIYRELEDYIIRDCVERVYKSPKDNLNTYKVKQTAESQKVIRAEIARIRPRYRKAIRKRLRKACEDSWLHDMSWLGLAYTVWDSMYAEDIYKTVLKRAYTEIENLNRTMLANLQNDMWDIKRLTDRGVQAGKKNRIGICPGSQMVMNTSIAQASGALTLAEAKELRINLVLVSSHVDARPEHAEWQGKIYHIKDEDINNLLSSYVPDIRGMMER